MWKPKDLFVNAYAIFYHRLSYNLYFFFDYNVNIYLYFYVVTTLLSTIKVSLVVDTCN